MTYSATDVRVGVPDITSVVLQGAEGDPSGITQLPSVTMAAKLGTIIKAEDLANNWDGEFIYLAVPVSTTVTVGLLYQFDKNYAVTLVPAKGTSQKSGVQVVLAYTAVTSNATTIQYAWFLYQGTAPCLKTAVTVPPQSSLYISGTAGRVYITASAGGTIQGSRTQNTATVTSTTSTVLIYIGPSTIDGA